MTILITLKREDIINSKMNTPKEELDLSCFDISYMLRGLAHTIHFVDDDNSVTVLKERY